MKSEIIRQLRQYQTSFWIEKKRTLLDQLDPRDPNFPSLVNSIIQDLNYPQIQIHWDQRFDAVKEPLQVDELSIELYSEGHNPGASGWQFDSHFPIAVPIHQKKQFEEQLELLQIIIVLVQSELKPYEEIFTNREHIFFRTVLFNVDPDSEKGVVTVKKRRDSIFGLIKAQVDKLNLILRELEKADKENLSQKYLG